MLCDRFSDSTLVYQGLSQGKSIEELALLRNLCSFASAGMAPDLTLVFDGRPEVLVRRRAARGVSDRYELQGLDFQQALRKGFLALAEAEPERLKLIDAEGSQEQVAASVQQALSALLHGEK